MKIYTKTGDKGETSLFGGKRVKKDAARIEAYGCIDETNAAIGVARSYIHEGSSGAREALSFIDATLETVQHKLFAVGAALAGSEDPAYGVKESDIEFLEKSIDYAEEQMQPLKNFILPFGTDLCARLHLARTVSRRAERRIVALSGIEQIDPNVLVYSNRLSDFLFTLARFANKAEGIPDNIWKKDQQNVIQPHVQQKLELRADSPLVEAKPNVAPLVKSGNGNGSTAQKNGNGNSIGQATSKV